MTTVATQLRKRVRPFPAISEGRYIATIAKNRHEVESALRLRHRVFTLELAGKPPDSTEIEFDKYDKKCKHLIVTDSTSGETVGTYRLNSLEPAGSISGFYSADEFTIEDLPRAVLEQGIEIGRACIDANHRNSKVLFLLWRALLSYRAYAGKRYFFGCCSIFTTDEKIGEMAFWQLKKGGFFDETFEVLPRRDGLDLAVREPADLYDVELPTLFNMYFRLGARVCGPPTIDREFGTIDFFVVFDEHKMNDKYRRMFG